MKTNKLNILLLALAIYGCSKDKKEPEINWEPCESELTISPPFQGACFPEVCDKYVYPIVPGMKEWDELRYLDFCQLPDKVLKSISTQGLIDALIHAPRFWTFYYYSSESPTYRWYGIYSKLNSATELLQRKDAANALLEYYKLVCFDCIETLIGEETWMGHYGVHINLCMMGLSFLFTKQEILDKMNHTQKKEAVAALLTNYEQCKTPEMSKSVNAELYATPMAYMMYADEYSPIVEYARDNGGIFLTILNGHVNFTDQEDVIISFAKNFINE